MYVTLIKSAMILYAVFVSVFFTSEVELK